MVYFNGTMIPEKEAAVPIADRGFRYGDGLFETMRAYSGRVFRLERHVARLVESASVLGIELGHIVASASRYTKRHRAPEITEELLKKGKDGELCVLRVSVARQIAEAVKTVVAANGIGEGTVRIILTRGTGGGFDVADELRPNLIVTARPFNSVPEEQARVGARAILSDIRRNTFSPVPRVKSLNFLENVLVRQEARRAGVDEGLMLDTEGHLVEASVSNLFFVKEGALHTPPTSCPILPGITREVVMALASERSVPCFERAISPEEMPDMEEAFTTSTLREVMPLVEINGQPVGTGKPGEVTRALMSAYRELVKEESDGVPGVVKVGF